MLLKSRVAVHNSAGKTFESEGPATPHYSRVTLFLFLFFTVGLQLKRDTKKQYKERGGPSRP